MWKTSNTVKKIRGKRFTTNNIPGLQNAKVGLDLSFNRKIGPVLDTDAYSLMYAQKPAYLRKYADYLNNMVSRNRTIQGGPLFKTEHIAPWYNTVPTNLTNITEPSDPPEPSDPSNDKIPFWEKPLTVFNMSKINLLTEQQPAKLNSFARVGIIIAGIGLWATKEHSSNYGIGILLGIVLALILLTTFNMVESFNILDPTPGKPIKYTPMDYKYNDVMMKRATPFRQKQQRQHKQYVNSQMLY